MAVDSRVTKLLETWVTPVINPLRLARKSSPDIGDSMIKEFCTDFYRFVLDKSLHSLSELLSTRTEFIDVTCMLNILNDPTQSSYSPFTSINKKHDHVYLLSFFVLRYIEDLYRIIYDKKVDLLPKKKKSEKDEMGVVYLKGSSGASSPCIYRSQNPGWIKRRQKRTCKQIRDHMVLIYGSLKYVIAEEEKFDQRTFNNLFSVIDIIFYFTDKLDVPRPAHWRLSLQMPKMRLQTYIWAKISVVYRDTDYINGLELEKKEVMKILYSKINDISTEFKKVSIPDTSMCCSFSIPCSVLDRPIYIHARPIPPIKDMAILDNKFRITDHPIWIAKVKGKDVYLPVTHDKICRIEKARTGRQLVIDKHLNVEIPTLKLGKLFKDICLKFNIPIQVFVFSITSFISTKEDLELALYNCMI